MPTVHESLDIYHIVKPLGYAMRVCRVRIDVLIGRFKPIISNMRYQCRCRAFEFHFSSCMMPFWIYPFNWRKFYTECVLIFKKSIEG